MLCREGILREQLCRHPHCNGGLLGNYWRAHNALIDGQGRLLVPFPSHHVVRCKDQYAARERQKPALVIRSTFPRLPASKRNENETAPSMPWPSRALQGRLHDSDGPFIFGSCTEYIHTYVLPCCPCEGVRVPSPESRRPSPKAQSPPRLRSLRSLRRPRPGAQGPCEAACWVTVDVA